MNVHNLPEDNDGLKQDLWQQKIDSRIRSEENRISESINQVLHEYSQDDFEGFVMTSVDGITGVDIMALSYVSQIRFDIDPMIRDTSTEIFLKIYYNNVFRKLLQGQGLINRASELLKEGGENIAIAKKLNDEFAPLILKNMKKIKADFDQTQKRLMKELGSSFVNVENKEVKARAVLQNIFGSIDLDSLGDSDRIGKEKVEVIPDFSVLDGLKKKSYNFFRFRETKIDPVELSNLVYVTRSLFKSVNQKFYDPRVKVVDDGYIRQAMDVYLHAYNIFLQENMKLEETWFSSTEKIVRYYTGTFELIDQRTDKNNFHIYEQKMTDIVDHLTFLSKKHEEELKKTDLPGQAIVELLRQNISKKNHWSVDSRLNQLVLALSDGLSESSMKKYLEKTTSLFQERGFFLKNNILEIKEILAEMERLAKDAIVRKNFFDLRNGQIKVDYFYRAYEGVIENPDLANMNTNEIVVSFKSRVNSLFLSYIRDTIENILDLDQLPDYQKTQAVKISKQIDDCLPKSQNISYVDRAGIIKIIEAINILCRLFRSQQLEIDNGIANNKITILPTVTLEFQKTMVEYIDEYREEIDRINGILFSKMYF